MLHGLWCLQKDISLDRLMVSEDTRPVTAGLGPVRRSA